MFKKVLDSTFVHMFGAFVAMGGWAFFANRLHPFDVAIKSALLQGLLSATITFFMKKALEALAARFQRQNLKRAALILPPLIVCSFSLAVLVGAHSVIGTPELLATVSIPFSVAFSYACLYSYRLWTKAKLIRGL